jgi:predicted acetylornithine/succinylornithine family transaminase
MSVEDLLSRDEEVIANTYHRLPVEIMRASGSFLFDKSGKKILDLLTGIAVLPLGHLHPVVKKAIAAQTNKYLHLSNYFADENQIALAGLLVEHTYADKVFFVNSGAEATEVAIKLARRWARTNKHVKACEIISTTNSFHGRTTGALSLTGQPHFHEKIDPLLGGVQTVPYNNMAAMAGVVGKRTAAVIVEPIQCEGGINMPLIDYLTQLKLLCKKTDTLLIVDEIQTGLGRTGRLLASEHSLMTPDITLLGKSLGGGMPLSAVLTTNGIAAAMGIGDHGTTMGGNPLAAAAGYATLRQIIDKKLIRRAEVLGNRFREALFDLSKEFTAIRNVRGMGLIIGFDYAQAGALVEEALKNGLLINKVQQETVRFLPPFTLSDEEFRLAMTLLKKSLLKIK